jgi:hypothetical protein
MLGQSAVVDDVVSENEYVLLRETAGQFSASLLLIECICSDEVTHRARVEGRTRGIPGWHEVGWDHVERMRAELLPMTADRLIVDAIEPVEDNIRRILDHIAVAS